MKIYFIFDGTKHEGPFTIEELQAIGIKRDTFVWKEGLPDWVHAEKLEELEYMLPAAPPPPVIVQPPAYPQPEPVVEEIKTPVVEETPVVAAKEEKPVLAEPVQSQKTEVKEIKEVKPVAVKQKISVVEEKPAAAAAVKPKTVVIKKVQPAGAAKKSNSGVWAFVILIVLGGGAAGYYFYKKNQDKKDVPLTKTNLLVQDTSTAVSAGNSDNSTGNSNEVVIDTPVNNHTTTPTKEVVILKPEKNLKTDPKPDKNNDPNKTEIKPDVKKDVVKPTVEETKPVKEDVKTVNPVENLTITGTYKKNILGEGVLEGKVHNGNGDVQFKSVVFEARFISGTGEVIKTQQFTKTGTLAAGDILSFKYRTDPPKDTKTVSYKIVSAQ